jgi:hypothetical protein
MLDMKEKVIYIKFAENLTDDAAKHLEKELIKKIGRHPKGSLTNGTDGGDGTTNFSSEVIERIKKKLQGRHPTEETRKKLSKELQNNGRE